MIISMVQTGAMFGKGRPRSHRARSMRAICTRIRPTPSLELQPLCSSLRGLHPRCFSDLGGSGLTTLTPKETQSDSSPRKINPQPRVYLRRSMVREQLPKRDGPRLRQELCAHHLPCEGNGGSSLPPWDEGDGVPGSPILGRVSGCAPRILPGSLGTSPLRGHFSLCAPAEEERAALELSPSHLPGSPHPTSHQLVHSGLGSTSLGAGATSHPPGLLNLSEGKPKGFSLRTTVGDPSCPRRRGWAPCSPPAIASVRHKVAASSQMRGCGWVPLWFRSDPSLLGPWPGHG